jgi:hypothetical protein
VRLSLRVRDLVVASWPTDAQTVAAVVYPGLEPLAVDGEHLVSLVGVRFAGGRLGRAPVPPFAQLNARTYVRSPDGPGVFFLRSYVTPGGLGGILFGAPLRVARVRVEPGRVAMGGAGVDVRFRVTAPAEPGEIGRHELGLFEAAGLRAFRIERGAAEWRGAEPEGEPRADVLLALGFEVRGRPRIFYVSGASFETELPPRKIAASRSRR